MDWRTIERGESAIIAAVGTAGFFLVLEGQLLAFLAQILLPDLAMVGYLWNARVGAAVYNSGHTYAAPALLGLAGVLTGTFLAEQAAVVWTVHIAADRALGFGLKRPEGFHHTHLDRD